MLGDSSTAALGSSSGDGPATAPAIGEDDRMKGDEFGERSFGGNRWPRQETIALLKIRSDMDVTFRDASAKGPLWEEVSRKLGELGYQRSAKKCKEKFENVYKYHKRTKDGRTAKPDGKTYRFFDQLAALENLPPQPLLMASPISSSHQLQVNAPLPPPTNHTTTTVPSIPLFPSPSPPHPNPTTTAAALRDITGDLLSNSTSSSSSSSSSSSTDVDDDTSRRNKKKRKWKDFFDRLMTEVIRRQEDLQKGFLEAVERREQERMAREESWRSQELSRINREREILSQERSVAAAKDAAVMSFLQKFSDHAHPPANIISSLPTQPPPPPPAAPAPPPPVPVIPITPSVLPRTTKPPPPPTPTPTPTPLPPQALAMVRAGEEDEGGGGGAASSSRWPKTEVHDLIKLRTSLEMKYQENGPKGPLWEEISAAMRRMGYNRSAKRCKEKWENINKYFKKVKESNKRRPEDSKTCPYYNLLEAIHREKMIRTTSTPTPGAGAASEINAVPLMVQPEQQWPPLVPPPQPSSAAAAAGQPNQPSEEEDDMEDDDGLEDEDDEEDDGGNNYELVASTKPNSVGAPES